MVPPAPVGGGKIIGSGGPPGNAGIGGFCAVPLLITAPFMTSKVSAEIVRLPAFPTLRVSVESELIPVTRTSCAVMFRSAAWAGPRAVVMIRELFTDKLLLSLRVKFPVGNVEKLSIWTVEKL